MTDDSLWRTFKVTVQGDEQQSPPAAAARPVFLVGKVIRREEEGEIAWLFLKDLGHKDICGSSSGIPKAALDLKPNRAIEEYRVDEMSTEAYHPSPAVKLTSSQARELAEWCLSIANGVMALAGNFPHHASSYAVNECVKKMDRILQQLLEANGMKAGSGVNNHLQLLHQRKPPFITAHERENFRSWGQRRNNIAHTPGLVYSLDDVKAWLGMIASELTPFCCEMDEDVHARLSEMRRVLDGMQAVKPPIRRDTGCENPVPRNWLLHALADALCSPTGQSVLLQADMGFGKSIVFEYIVNTGAACLIPSDMETDASDDDSRPPIAVAASHAFKVGHKQTTCSPAEFVRSLSSQLRRTCKGYADKVSHDPHIEEYIRPDSSKTAEDDGWTALKIAVLTPLSEMEDLKAAGLKACKGIAVIALDGLDEAAEAHSTKIVDLVLKMADFVMDNIPWMRILCTSRPNVRELYNYQGHGEDGTFAIVSPEASDEGRIRDDLLAFLEQEISASDALQAKLPNSSAIDELLDGADGCFLWLHHAVDHLERFHEIPVESLPRGIRNIYQTRFKAHFERLGDFNRIRPLLEILIAGDGSIYLSDLFQISSFSPERIPDGAEACDRSMRALRPFLSDMDELAPFLHTDGSADDPENSVVSIPHWSLSDWLQQRTDFCCAAEQGELLIGAWMLSGAIASHPRKQELRQRMVKDLQVAPTKGHPAFQARHINSDDAKSQECMNVLKHLYAAGGISINLTADELHTARDDDEDCRIQRSVPFMYRHHKKHQECFQMLRHLIAGSYTSSSLTADELHTAYDDNEDWKRLVDLLRDIVSDCTLFGVWGSLPASLSADSMIQWLEIKQFHYHCGDLHNVDLLTLILDVMPVQDIEIQELLVSCCNNGAKEPAALLLHRGGDASTSLIRGDGTVQDSPLQAAAASGCTELVKLLVEKGADPNAFVDGQRLPVHAGAGHRDVMAYLVSQGADIRVRDHLGRTTLHCFAKQSKSREGLKFLLDSGLDLEARDSNGATPICLASCEEALVALIEAGAIVDECDDEGRTVLHHAACNFGMSGDGDSGDGNEFFLKRLLNLKLLAVDAAPKGGKTALQVAAEERKQGAVEMLLLHYGASPAAVSENQGITVLHSAARGGAPAIVGLVLGGDGSLAADPAAFDFLGRTALHHACEGAAASPLGSGGTFTLGESPIITTAISSHEQVVKNLVENGAEVDARDIYGRTPLMLAGGNEGVLETLLDNGADPNATDNNGVPAILYLAAEAVGAQLLMERGEDVQGKDGAGRSALHLACGKILPEGVFSSSDGPYSKLTWADFSISRITDSPVQRLLEVLGDSMVNETDSQGFAPLHYAAFGNELCFSKEQWPKQMERFKTQMDGARDVKALLDAGADIDALGGPGVTALFIAEAMGHEPIVQLLLERGACATKALLQDDLWNSIHRSSSSTAGEISPDLSSAVRTFVDSATIAHFARLESIAASVDLQDNQIPLSARLQHMDLPLLLLTIDFEFFRNNPPDENDSSEGVRRRYAARQQQARIPRCRDMLPCWLALTFGARQLLQQVSGDLGLQPARMALLDKQMQHLSEDLQAHVMMRMNEFSNKINLY